jgi:solute carrier family 35 protein F1/2
MLVCFILLKSRYHWSQLLGVAICIGGLVILVVSDMRTGKDWGYANKVKGDLFMLLGATLYGVSNGLEEFLVRGRPLYEVVGQLGFWGFIVNGILVGGYEHATVYEAVWSGRNVGFLIGYVSAMLILYTLAPILFRFASSPFYNLSLMTSDFYSLLIGLSLFGYKPYYLYFIAYPMVVVGLIVYNIYAPLESHAKTIVKARGKQAEMEETTGRARVIGAPQGKLGSIM